MARRRARPHYLINTWLGFLVLVIFAATGLRVAGNSSAATTNPYGYADYCALENNTTVIYGWAADPNATSLNQPAVTITAGGKAVTTDTNRAGYRDAPINAWIDQNRAGDPKPGTYGFRAAIDGLYKGNDYTITGTALNEGPGSSVILTINTSGYTDGDSSKPYFANNLIPQSCLPTAAPPAPTPAPTPKPAPAPAPKPIGGTPSAQTVTLSDAANATPTVGTLAAAIQIPYGGASLVHVVYGTDPLVLDQSTLDQPTNGADSSVLVSGLDPVTQYHFQIVRSGGGKSTTSVAASFTTLGFIVQLHFVDSQQHGIQGVPVSIDNQKNAKKSDDNGNVQFTDIPAGTHTVTYTYQNRKYSKTVVASASTVSPDDAAASKVVTIYDTINIQKTASIAKPAGKGSSWLGAVIPIVLGITALVLAIIGYNRRRLRNRYQNHYEDYPTAPLPDYQPAPQEPYEPLPLPSAKAVAPKPDQAEHMGLSLKEMVLRSMAEEARRREEEK